MFGIANAVAYDHLMVQAKRPGDSAIGDILGPSAWIDVRGGAAEKWCTEEGEVVLELLRRLARSGAPSDLYLVTPFVVVADNLRRLVRQAELNDWLGNPADWAKTHIGTVHTVQGREAEAVILVLGAPASEQTGARNWAGGRPNLLNVAVTRAKERLYVVGNRELWREAGVFRELAGRLESRSL
jgi:superfamily I DNA and/or RNA helicase